MRLPKSFNDITVGQYQKIYFLLKENTNESWVAIISELSGKPYDEIEAIPIRELKLIIKRLDFILRPEVLHEKVKKYIAVRGRICKAIYQADLLNTAQLVDIKTFLQPTKDLDQTETTVVNAHRLLASIYLPLTWRGFRYTNSHKKLAEDFKGAKMGDVYGTLFFYSVLWERLIECSLEYGKNQAEFLKTHLEEVTQFLTSEEGGTGK